MEVGFRIGDVATCVFAVAANMGSYLFRHACHQHIVDICTRILVNARVLTVEDIPSPIPPNPITESGVSTNRIVWSASYVVQL